MALSNDEIRDVLISFLDEEVSDINGGLSVEFVRGEITAVAYMLEMFNLPKLADIVERHYKAKLYSMMLEEMQNDEYEET